MNDYEKPVPFLALIGFGALVVIALFVLPVLCGQALAVSPGDTTLVPDPLATPKLPENPTGLELGHYSYYYNCMPCHGDKGQGLTDEWRQVWVEDHQNCWRRGCHSGKPGDEGFPLPENIPPVMNTSNRLSRFDTADALLAYLRATHPPQRPGVLPDEDYHALTLLLWVENGRQSQSEDLQSEAGRVLTAPMALVGVVVAVILAVLVLHLIASHARRRQK